MNYIAAVNNEFSGVKLVPARVLIQTYQSEIYGEEFQSHLQENKLIKVQQCTSCNLFLDFNGIFRAHTRLNTALFLMDIYN